VTLRGGFLAAALPAAIVILVIFYGVRETAGAFVDGVPARPGIARSWGALGSEFKILLLALLLFTLGNSTDAFIILSLSQAGLSAGWIAALWSLHHLVMMAAAYYGGILSDRFGPRLLILASWGLYALIYLGFALASAAPARAVLFLAYGLYFGFTEPAEKSWVARSAAPRLRGTAFGLYHGTIGLGALPASLMFGFLWQACGAPAAFLTGAGFAALASVVVPGIENSIPISPHFLVKTIYFNYIRRPVRIRKLDFQGLTPFI
jgi:MFS family permease